MQTTCTRLSVPDRLPKDHSKSPCCSRDAKPKVSAASLLLAFSILLLPLASGSAESGSSSSDGISFLQAPQGAKRITISLAVVEGPSSRQSGYRSPQPLDELLSLPPSVAETYSGTEYSAFQIAAFPDGTRYLVVLSQDTHVKFLNRNESDMWYARVYRISDGSSNSAPQLLREGFQSPGNEVTIPVDLPLPGIGTTKVKSCRTVIGYSLNSTQNGHPQVYSARGSAVQVTGSEVSEVGKLTLTVTVPNEMTVTPETQVSLRFEPLKPGLPDRAVSGKITEFLTLGAARFVMTALAPDFSSATLALVSGSLEQTLDQQLQLGAQMPTFAQLDLLNRRTITREGLLHEARTSAGVVFVFGEIVPAKNRFGPGYSPPYGGNTTLPLPPGGVTKQLGVELKSKPIVVLVTRQIDIDFLYDDLRDQTPDYQILADYTDPLRTNFRLPQYTPGGWYGPTYPVSQDQPSLRQLFILPANTLAIVAFDRKGKVVYVKADAASSFLQSLAEARSALVAQAKTQR
jgi:hypothetical protein